MYNDVSVLEPNQACNNGHHGTGERREKGRSAADLELHFPIPRFQAMTFTDLRRPSGSKGAWHQEGASGGRGPFSGELMLHCCHKTKGIIRRPNKQETEISRRNETTKCYKTFDRA